MPEFSPEFIEKARWFLGSLPRGNHVLDLANRFQLEMQAAHRLYDAIQEGRRNARS